MLITKLFAKALGYEYCEEHDWTYGDLFDYCYKCEPERLRNDLGAGDE